MKARERQQAYAKALEAIRIDCKEERTKYDQDAIIQLEMYQRQAEIDAQAEEHQQARADALTRLQEEIDEAQDALECWREWARESRRQEDRDSRERAKADLKAAKDALKAEKARQAADPDYRPAEED